MLATLNYLPVSFNPDPSYVSDPLEFFKPQAGSFTWKYPELENYLGSTWDPATYNVILKGAIMNFEAQNNLAIDGIAGPDVWRALSKDFLKAAMSSTSYDFVYVNMSLPEKLYLYQNGNLIFTSLTNTGIAQAPTAPGIFPIYSRYLSTTMSGRNPDGTSYDDPGIPWVSYFNGGDALHGFLRSAYGFPQSLGCVELPYSAAHTVFENTTYGTLVDVSY